MRTLAIVAGCIALALMASGVYAQGGAPKTGKVTAVDVEKKTVTVDLPARPLTFDVNAETKITEGGAAKTLADIKVGATVEVTYSKAGDEKRVASAIKIVPAAGGPSGEIPKEKQK